MRITTGLDWHKSKHPKNYYLSITIYGHKDKLEKIQEALKLLLDEEVT